MLAKVIGQRAESVAQRAVDASRGSPARRAALWWLAGYLAASGFLLLRNGETGLASLHLALIVCAGMLSRMDEHAPRAIRAAGDLLPLVVCPLLYFEIPGLIAATGTVYHDQFVQRLEAAVFGGQLSRTFAAAIPARGFSELVHAGYLAYYPLIFVPPLRLLMRGDRAALSRTVLVLTVVFTACWITFAFFPVEGPRFLTPVRDDIPSGPFRNLAVHLLASGSARGAAFPSSHMAVIVAQAVAAWRPQRRLAVLIWCAAGLVGLGAVYGGFHYASDIVAGALLGGTLAAAVVTTIRIESPERSRA